MLAAGDLITFVGVGAPEHVDEVVRFDDLAAAAGLVPQADEVSGCHFDVLSVVLPASQRRAASFWR
ncbi:hypothetical protein D9M70_586880 [compost metagenome]